MPQYFLKQPAENKDYQFDWDAFLDPTSGDTIGSAVVTATPSGITLGSQTINPTNVTQFISGGVDGTDYKITCKITTAQGRIAEAEIFISVREV